MKTLTRHVLQLVERVWRGKKPRPTPTLRRVERELSEAEIAAAVRELESVNEALSLATQDASER